MQQYHDAEWGIPVHDDQKLLEMLTLEGAQAGLSWLTILKRRDGYRKAFNNFDPAKISKYTGEKKEELMSNEGIIRNKLKIEAAVKNAKAFLAIQKEFKTFDSYIWQFVSHTPLINRRKSMKDIPARSKESDLMSIDLKKRGFSFVGSTICYAFMQAVGMANDHTLDCFLHPSKMKKA